MGMLVIHVADICVIQTFFSLVVMEDACRQNDLLRLVGIQCYRGEENSIKHQITATANRTLAFVRRNLYSCPQHIQKSAYTTVVRPLLEYSSSVWDPHTKTLVNKIEMVQKHAARFCHNGYKTIEKGCVSEMIRKLNLEPLNIRRTNKRLTIFHKAMNGHFALPIGHLQPVLRRTRHLNSKAYKPSTPAKTSTHIPSSPGQ